MRHVILYSVSHFFAIFANKNKRIVKRILLYSLFLMLSATAFGARDTIDISGNNTSSDYKTYDAVISMPSSKTVDVLMARYSYFNSYITGRGTLNLHAGGERCYLGTAKGASYPNWTKYTGDVHIYPYKEKSPSAGFYGIVMAHGGKTFSVEDVEGSLGSGKVNIMMENNRVFLHQGATIVCESGTRGFRFGELNTEAGSNIQGYMKKGTQNSYFLVGCMGTDATLAGTIAPPDFSASHKVGLLKEGDGTYRITGNNNFISGALRVLGGKMLIMNDRSEAETKKLRGATGAMASDADAVVLVFEKGQLGGTGNIAGTVDNYGIIEPGDNAIGELAIKNYAVLTQKANLYVRPASVLRFKISSAESYDRLTVSGNVKYYNICQDFSQSTDMPVVELAVADDATVKVGDEFVLLTAAGKTSQAGEWQFALKSTKYTFALDERITDSGYEVVARVVSLNDSEQGDDDDDSGSGDEADVMGPFYDDGINDNTDRTPLRSYAAKNGKLIGTAISTWKNDITNDNLSETKEIGTQFNLLVAENEMKFDALQPARGEFNFWAADNLVNFAERNKMTVRGHCLAWHQQVPEWVSSDGKKNDKNWTRAEALELLKNHINQVMNHFKGKVVEWDVVNECLDDNQTSIRSNPDGYDLRATVWQRAIGDDYIDSAFVYAHRADPDAQLYLNDYGVELQGKAKTTAFYNLAMRLKKSGIPLHGVGLQCHFSIGEVDSVKLDNTIKRFGDAGLKCIITELDMGVPSTSDKDLEEQARNYRVITDIVLNHDNCPSLVIWGLKDNDSWRSDSNPLLYNAELGKKPAYYAVRSALRHRAIVNDTGIESVPVRPIDSNAVYDLRGCRVDENNLKPGIYIKGGKKVVK